jgi:phage terminase large subunit
MKVSKEIADRFENFVFDWDFETYLAVGGYGSAKSYHIAFKLIIKLLNEKRKCLVVREVYDTITESCFDLFAEILNELDLLIDDSAPKQYRRVKVLQKKSPMGYEFPNGSRIIFKGMDKTDKVKSINGVSIVWLEECSEIKYAAFKELLGRIRTPGVTMHYILSCNPVGKENWVYRHFFKRMDDDGKEVVVLDDEELYAKHTIVRNGVYYHHSVPDDNPFLPKQYLKRLDEIKLYDEPLWRVARLGRFGANGTRVLPQFIVAESAALFKQAIRAIPRQFHFVGMDFGFEESYNAVVRMAVDDYNKILYIYDEIYINHVTDLEMAHLSEMQTLKDDWIVADNEDPKAIKFYRMMGYKMRGCRNKFAGSRLSNTRKVKRFKQIICSPKCVNCIRELKDLTYKKDAKGNVLQDEFVIDPHTFSAIWYGLDEYTVADVKERKSNSKAG